MISNNTAETPDPHLIRKPTELIYENESINYFNGFARLKSQSMLGNSKVSNLECRPVKHSKQDFVKMDQNSSQNLYMYLKNEENFEKAVYLKHFLAK